MKDTSHCGGCRQNFYNGNNSLGVRRCWHLKAAKLVWRYPVHRDQRPPYRLERVQVPNCYSPNAMYYVEKSVIEGWNWACREAQQREQLEVSHEQEANL